MYFYLKIADILQVNLHAELMENRPRLAGKYKCSSKQKYTQSQAKIPAIAGNTVVTTLVKSSAKYLQNVIYTQVN